MEEVTFEKGKNKVVMNLVKDLTMQEANVMLGQMKGRLDWLDNGAEVFRNKLLYATANEDEFYQEGLEGLKEAVKTREQESVEVKARIDILGQIIDQISSEPINVQKELEDAKNKHKS